MEATYSLEVIKDLINKGAYFVTATAADSARRDFNFNESEIIDVVYNLSQDELYKTMSSEKKPELWQDVYKPVIPAGEKRMKAYVKLQVQTNKRGEKAVIISFKKA